MDEFEPYRLAARTGIEASGGEPLLVEDRPSLGHSSRTACLDLVASADVFVIVVGERGGWTAPSGKLVVEEEWEEARRRKIPVRAFLQEGVTRDADAARLAADVSDYVTGLFRRTFTDPASLAAEVERALGGVTPLPTDAMTPTADDLRALALAVGGSAQHAQLGQKTLRVVVAPERPGEVVDPRTLDDEAFHHAVMSAAQNPAHRIVPYGQPVVPRVQGTALVLGHASPGHHQQASRPPRVEVHEHGLVLVDVPLDPPQQNGLGMGGMLPSHVLDEGRVEEALTASLRFVGAVYGLPVVDPHLRYERLRIDAALAGVQGGVLERDPQPRSSYTIPDAWMTGGHGASAPVAPLQVPRTVSRDDLDHPGDEVSRLMTYLRRALAA